MKKILLLAAVCVLFGCGQPLPESRLDYAGEWESQEMYLLILADGTVAYERLQNGGKTSINGPVQEFVGDDFTVGLSFLNTTFDVDQAPYQEDGRWYMVVDGIKLRKSLDAF